MLFEDIAYVIGIILNIIFAPVMLWLVASILMCWFGLYGSYNLIWLVFRLV